jgi:hypothetical protein
MKPRWTQRLATRQAPDRGLRPPDRAGGGVLILDWNPWPPMSDRWNTMLPPGILCGIIALIVVVICSALERRSLGILGFLVCVLSFIGLLWYAVIRRLFGREQLRIGARGLDYLLSDGLVRKRREIPFAEIRRLTPYGVMVAGGDHRLFLPGGLFHPEYGLAIETLGRTLCVGQNRHPEQIDQLREDVMRILGEWDPAWVDAPECPDREILDASGTRPEPPSDSALTCRREWDRTEFRRRYRLDRSAAVHSWSFALIFFALLCVTLATSTQTVTPLILTLLVATGLLLPLAEARRCWVVRPGEITTSVGIGGLGWSRTTEIEWLDRIELRRSTSNTLLAPSFRLALIDLDGKVKVVFGPLTEGEARWMAGIVADVLKDALPRSGQEVYRWSVTVDPPAAGSRAMADAWLDESLDETGPKASAAGQKR